MLCCGEAGRGDDGRPGREAKVNVSAESRLVYRGEEGLLQEGEQPIGDEIGLSLYLNEPAPSRRADVWQGNPIKYTRNPGLRCSYAGRALKSAAFAPSDPANEFPESD